jgi:hypothetical protein
LVLSVFPLENFSFDEYATGAHKELVQKFKGQYRTIKDSKRIENGHESYWMEHISKTEEDSIHSTYILIHDPKRNSVVIISFATSEHNSPSYIEESAKFGNIINSFRIK